MLKNKIQAASNLTPNDRWMFTQAWVLLIVFDLGLRMLPFPRVQAYAAESRPVQKPLPSTSVEVEIQRIWRIMRIASRNHIYSMTCLRRSLALQRILNGRGIRTELRFGVQKEAGQLQAHAWLEYQGKPIGEPESLTEDYAAMLTRQASSKSKE